MCLETAQILSTAARRHGGQPTYRSTHANHPVVVWCSLSRGNYLWTLRHFESLLAEFNLRRGKQHSCANLLAELTSMATLLPDAPQTPHANCAANKSLDLDFKHMPVYEAYKAYLKARWARDKLTPRW